MPVNDFEKQVSQKMGELKFQPSEEVWVKVEARIRKEKKRRWLFWIPLLGLLFIGGGYFIFKGTRSPGKEQNTIAQLNRKSSVLKEAPTVKPTDEIKPVENKAKPAPDNETEVEKTDRQANQQNKKSKPSLSFQSGVHREPQKRADDEKHLSGLAEDVQVKQNESVQTEKTKQDGVVKKETREEINTSNSKEEQEGETINNEAKNKDLSAIEIKKDKENIEKGNKNEKIEVKEVTDSTSEKALTANSPKKENPDSSVVKTSVTKAIQPFSKKWKFGISAKLGSFKNSEGLFNFLSLEKSASADYQSNSGSGGGAVVIPPPSALKSGIAWGIGLQAFKPITERLSFSTGLQYAYYSDSRNVGTRRDSTLFLRNDLSNLSVSYSYQNGQTQTYSNHYHFLEIPFLLQWKFSKHAKVPVAAEGGFTLAQLISSDALFYDPVTGIYYEDKSLFHKTQLQLNLGITFGLFEKTKHPLQIGPILQYGLTSQYKTYNNIKERLSFAGLKAGWHIGKK